ncbi:hypothetical protein WHI96_18295 [Pseudonocardia tropica]|uniref:6-phosphogluconate dehydrogenase NADP-binding domain-containing protein n=1 Tax=Pseudonocardia tropica TaxID=681289 RepID=A0ABV1K0V0_9PSEU
MNKIGVVGCGLMGAGTAPPPLLARMVEAGLPGNKSGRGFHSYT